MNNAHPESAAHLLPDAREEFEGLLKVLGWADEHALLFAVVNSQPARYRLAQTLQAQLHVKGVIAVEVTLDRPEYHPLRALLQRAPSSCLRDTHSSTNREAQRMVLFIFGLEQSLYSDEHRWAALNVLNLNRERFRETFRCPMVFWLPQPALEIIAEVAPDFWSWRSGVYYLALEPDLIEDALDVALNPDLMALMHLTDDVIKQTLAKAQMYLEKWSTHAREMKYLETIRGHLLAKIGRLYLRLREYERGIGQYQRGLEIFRQVGDEMGTACVLLELGRALGQRGRHIEAQSCIEESQRLFDDLQDYYRQASALHELGRLTYEQDDSTKASTYYEKILEIADYLDDPLVIGLCLGQLGQLAERVGKFGRAAGLYERALHHLQHVDSACHAVIKACLERVAAAHTEDNSRTT